jgi:SH3 domain protein
MMKLPKILSVSLTKIVFLTAIVGSSSIALAETRYVKDTLVINFRSGPSNEYKITKRPKSGTVLEFIEESANGNWSKVKMGNSVGWVLTQYLVKTPVASVVVKQQEKTINTLTAQVTELKSSLSDTQTTRGDLSTQLETLTRSNQELTLEFNNLKLTAKNAVSLEKQNGELLELNKNLSNQNDTLKASNDYLKKNEFTSYLIAGAGIFFMGMLLPALFGYRKKQSKGGWS